MAKSAYISGTGPGSGKSVVALGVVELLAGHGRKMGFFRPLVADAAVPDRLTALVAGRCCAAAPLASGVGVGNDVARDLLTRGRDDELQALILDAYRRLAEACDFVVSVGTDYRALHAALELDFNVEVARNLGAPLLAVIPGQGRPAGELADAVRVLAESLEEMRCDLLAVVTAQVAGKPFALSLPKGACRRVTWWDPFVVRQAHHERRCFTRTALLDDLSISFHPPFRKGGKRGFGHGSG